MVRAATYAVADGRRSAVTLTLLVPEGFSAPIEGGGASCTAIIDAAEVLRLAADLRAAAEAASAVAPPLYG
jgi:hypothetical protein